MRYAKSAAAFLFLLLLAGATPVGPEIAHPGRAVDPSALPEFGVNKAGSATGFDLTSLAFMALWATIVVTVMVLWYRRLRFDEDLEGRRPRIPEDEQ